MATSESGRIAAVYAGYHASPDAGNWYASRGNRAISAERRRCVQRLLRRAGLLPLAGRDILEIGCGFGGILQLLRDHCGADESRMTGVDVRPDVVEVARAALPTARLEAVDGRALPVADASADLVVTFTVFSSVLDDAPTAALAAEAMRALRPGGHILWYDMRRTNPWNRAVRPFGRAQIAQLFPGFAMRGHSLTLLPPIARRLGIFTRPLYPLLGALPPLRSHLLVLLKKP